MAKTLILLTSVTYAYKAQKLLEKHWIRCAVVRTPKTLSDLGCSYSLQVDPSRAEEAEALIRKNGIRITKVVTL